MERRGSAAFLDKRQTTWNLGIPRDRVRPSYVAELQDNLFLRPINRETANEFEAGDGAELHDNGGRPAKMRALVSSSALAVNFFDAWRHANKSPLASALQLSSPITHLCFEFKTQ